ncbi:MAG: hypothetical protein V4751_14160 [Pseudomonadota bacterium]
MAETINIAKMAEKLSKEIFGEFLWQMKEHTNINWECESVDNHKVKTHPSDVVFWYDEPYTQSRTYVNCDLKSYAKGSISQGSVREALVSLAKTLSCAETSQKFNDMYIHQDVSPNICGLLFIYNHDGEYDKDFSSVLDKIKNEELDIPKGSKIVVLGPEDIYWLNNVHHEIAYLRGGSAKIPAREHCKYFYPHLVLKKNVQLEHAKAATLEMLTAPWIILSYQDPSNRNRKGVVVFVRKRGSAIEEFLYLIDYLMHYQVVSADSEVTIRLLDPDPLASAHFSNAKDQYISNYEGGQEIRNRLNAIEFGKINNVRTIFSELELSRQ